MNSRNPVAGSLSTTRRSSRWPPGTYQVVHALRVFALELVAGGAATKNVRHGAILTSCVLTEHGLVNDHWLYLVPVGVRYDHDRLVEQVEVLAKRCSSGQSHKLTLGTLKTAPPVRQNCIGLDAPLDDEEDDWRLNKALCRASGVHVDACGQPVVTGPSGGSVCQCEPVDVDAVGDPASPLLAYMCSTNVRALGRPALFSIGGCMVVWSRAVD